jgi:hypothetical protein
MAPFTPILHSQGLYLIEKGVAQGIGVGHGDEALKQDFHLRQPAREPLGLLQEPALDVNIRSVPG